MERIRQIARWLFSSQPGEGARTSLLARWIFLRLLGLIAFAAFFSLVFQIRGLLGPHGILPAGEYLAQVAQVMGAKRLWFAPTFLWAGASNGALLAICWAGMLAGIALMLNLWPRASLMVAFLCYLSFVAVGQDFAGYQSDGMLLEALFLAFFFAPQGLRPGLGAQSPPSRASLFLLQWEWFRIYFESGMVKLLSGDPEWRNFTAMDDYYQNGPLPTWVGWYVAPWPHRFHVTSAFLTLVVELGVVWMFLLPRRWRIACFCIVTPWEIGVILTANYTFLNYLVLVLGVLLLDDRFVNFVSARLGLGRFRTAPVAQTAAPTALPDSPLTPAGLPEMRRRLALEHSIVGAIFLSWIFYATTYEMIAMPFGGVPMLPRAPIAALEPFRIANSYGLFAVMTRGRYEIEFQGSNDGRTWMEYPFRYKPQALNWRPRIYAPYQPRLDWNLWFASLGDWRSYPIVPQTEIRLAQGSPEVLALFAGNPFAGAPPKYVRAVLYQYWFTTAAEKRATGDWWKNKYLGVYAPVITRAPALQPGAAERFVIVQPPDVLPEHD
jgi:hypothetical protein